MIRFDDVGRTYAPLFGPRVHAVDGMTFGVDAGEVFGIAGPNGAGKSTMIAMLLGFLPPSDGRITVDTQAPRVFVERHGMGYLSELIAIHPRWRTRESLVRLGTLAGIPAASLDARVDELMTLFGLDEHARKRTKELSKGTLQRLGLAQALLRDDERVLILDEPTHGLDPLWTQHFRELVPRLRRPDRAIVIASHNLDELERLADRVAIVDRGRLQRIVRTRGEAHTAATRYRLVVRAAQPNVEQVFPGAVAAGDGEYEVPVADLASLNRGLAALIERGVLIVTVAPAYSSLEAQFRQAVGEGT